MSSSRREFIETSAMVCAAAILSTSEANAADGYVPFQSEKTTWHEGFERYDFTMDDATGAITPMTAPASEVTSFGGDLLVRHNCNVPDNCNIGKKFVAAASHGLDESGVLG